MTLVKFPANNHPQQIGRRGARDEIDDRATPPEVFDPLHERFGFTLDVAAAAHNAKCARFFDRELDGLAQSWAGERVWCNPPYSDIGAWVTKAWSSWPAAELVVALLPANRTEQRWWQEFVEPHWDRSDSPLRVEFLRGRLRFLLNGATAIKPNERPPFGCCLLVWEADR